jgi:membrane fusion protein (multidrug efflux system)
MRKGVKIGLVALAVLAAGGALTRLRPWEHVATASPSAGPSASASARAGAPSEVVVADAVKVGKRPMATVVPAPGTLVPNESVAITSELSRRVAKVFAKDGARVKKGDVLFKLDDLDLGAELNELTVKKKLAEDVEARQKKLRAEGLSSEADYEKAKSDVALAAAQISSLSVTMSRTSIRAPFDGLLGLRQVSEGAMVSPSTTLVTLTDDTSLKVDVLLPERYAPLVEMGATFTFHVEGLDSPFEAKVVAVEPAVLSDTRSVKVRGLTDNAAGKLRPGAFVNVDFPLSKRTDAILVPTVAVIPSLGGHSVYRVADGKVVEVEVELGVRTPTEIEITKGLSPGDVVLVTNLLRVRPGGPVKLGKVDE